MAYLREEDAIYASVNTNSPILYKINVDNATFDNCIRLPFTAQIGAIIKNKDGINLLSWFRNQTTSTNVNYGNGIATNHLIYKKVLCLED